MHNKCTVTFFLVLCRYGLAYIAIPRLSEDGSVSLSPQDNYESQIQSRFIPLPFGGFGFFQNKQRVKNDVATLQTQVAQLTTDVAQLMAFENRVQSLIQLLNANGINSTSIIDAYRNLPRCPSRAAQVGGKLVGSFCYTVSTIKMTFDQALKSCNVLGGTLAEVPELSEASKELYNAIGEQFPKQFAEIAANNPYPGTLWIGFRKANANDVDFIAPFSQRTVAATDPIFSGTDTTQANGAAIENGGKTWVGLGLVDIPDVQLPYICQFFLV